MGCGCGQTKTVEQRRVEREQAAQRLRERREARAAAKASQQKKG